MRIARPRKIAPKTTGSADRDNADDDDPAWTGIGPLSTAGLAEPSVKERNAESLMVVEPAFALTTMLPEGGRSAGRSTVTSSWLSIAWANRWNAVLRSAVAARWTLPSVPLTSPSRSVGTSGRLPM